MRDDPTIRLDLPHRVRFTRGAFQPDNPLLADLLHSPDAVQTKVLVVVDSGVLAARPGLEAEVRDYFTHHADRLPQLVGFRAVPGGEDAKNDLGFLEGLLGDVNRTGLCKRSFILAIGGGAVLDMVGFAAAVSHRGVRLLRVPTTTLAQADAGIGVKNGVNMFGKKNFLGTFAVPAAVINDLDLLATLSDRDWRGGLSEAVKVALLKDAVFFDWLCDRAAQLARRDDAVGEYAWRRCAELHVRHIATAGDPFELGGARPLDFGHWAAHKLEQVTSYELRHGEAVAIGLALDTLYSRNAGLLADAEARRVLDCLAAMGFTLHHPAMRDADTLIAGLEEFRQHLGGELTITLLRGVGQPVEAHEIDTAAMRDAIAELTQFAATRAIA